MFFLVILIQSIVDEDVYNLILYYKYTMALWVLWYFPLQGARPLRLETSKQKSKMDQLVLSEIVSPIYFLIRHIDCSSYCLKAQVNFCFAQWHLFSRDFRCQKFDETTAHKIKLWTPSAAIDWIKITEKNIIVIPKIFLSNQDILLFL